MRPFTRLSTFASLRACLAALAVAASAACAAPAAAQTVQLADWLAAGRIRAVGRTPSPVADGARTVVRLDSLAGTGVAWLEGVELGDGTIEVELRGADLPGASFVGIAFHGVSDSTYEAVYLRPFNFRHADSASRAHAIQYVSHPGYPWRRLRTEHPGVYEQPIDPPPAPDAWVRLRLEIAHPEVRVYVNGAERPSLVVRQLGSQRRGRVGLWVGNPSAGDFATLRVVPAGAR